MFDQNLMFSDQQNLAQAIGSYVSTSIDAWRGKTTAAGTPNVGGPLLGDFGRGTDKLDQVGIVTQTFTSGGAATLQIQQIQADDANLTVNVEVLRESRALGFALFTAGRVLNMGKTPSLTRRFFGWQYTIGAAATTAGKITSGLTKGVFSNDAALLL